MNATLSRRQMLASGGALVVALTLDTPVPGLAAVLAGKSVDPKQVDAYLAVNADGSVTLYSGKVDLGTGLRAAFPQIAAEELGLTFDRIRLVEGDTALTPDQGATAGSNGISRGGMQVRQAAATARQALIRLGAAALNLPEGDLDAIDGEVRPRTGGKGVSFAALIAGKSFNLALDPKAPPRKPATYRIVGKPVRRPDIPAKITGRHVYMHDFEVPGMLHGRVIRPAAQHVSIASVDESSVAAIPGVRVVRIGDFLGVVAPNEWDAVRAARQLKVTWNEEALPTTSRDLADWVRTKAPAGKDEVISKRGDYAAAMATAARKVTAEFYWPTQSHASIGPSCAIADVKDGEATIWCSSQGTHGYRKHFAAMLDLPADKTRVIYVDGAGCYGMNGHEDAAADAAFLSKAAGAPVRVQWMRHDEHAHDPKGPPQVITQEVGLSADGRIVAWGSQMWVPAKTAGLENIPLLAPAEAGARQTRGLSPGSVSDGAFPSYDVPNAEVTVHWLTGTPLRPSHLRAPGRPANLLAIESMMDELALTLGQDPLAFRLAHVTSPRGREVLQRVASLSGWESRATLRRDGKGRGIGYVQYKGTETLVAMVMDVEVEASGRIHVKRVSAAHDCGQIISPDGVRAQVEGCILQTLGRTLFEEVTYDTKQVTSTDWASYPILTFPDVPELRIELIDRPDEAPTGAGEAACSPVAAALANAVFDATGIHLRHAPFTIERVKAAMAEAPDRAG